MGISEMMLLSASWGVVSRHIPLRVIRTEEEYKTQQQWANTLADEVGDNEAHPLFSLFEVVLLLIEQWESKHVSIPDAPPKEVLRFLLQDHGLRQKDLADIASKQLISDILAGRRPVSRKLAVKLAKRFNVGVSAFI